MKIQGSNCTQKCESTRVSRTNPVVCTVRMRYFSKSSARSRNLFFSYAVLFVAGICLIGLFSSITSLVQLNVTDELRGRVMSIFMLAFRGGMPLGNLVAGYLASRFSPSTALIAGSGLLGTTALAFLLSNSGVKKL